MVVFIAFTGKASWAIREPAEYQCAISIIMPVYNTEAYLKECIDSILGQAFGDIELIVVDDESTDGSLEILREYERLDERVRVFSIPHGGQSAARNRGMREACGKFVYFMDSDDKLAVGALEVMHALIEERGVDVLYFSGKAFFDSEDIAHEFAQYNHCYRHPVSYRDVVTGVEMFVRMSRDRAYWVQPCLQIARREYLQAIGLRFYEGIIYEDNISTFECMLQAGRTSHENVALFLRRIRQQSTVTSPMSYRNFYGYFICWNEMMSFVLSHHFKEPVREILNRYLRSIRSLAIENGAALPNTEIKVNMKRESLFMRSIYYFVFHANIVRLRRKSTGVQENGLSKAVCGIIGSAKYRMGQAMIITYDRLKQPIRP